MGCSYRGLNGALAHPPSLATPEVVQPGPLRRLQIFPLPADQAYQITQSPSNGIWLTETPDLVGNMNYDGTVSWLTLGSNPDPVGITTGPDGNIWFTEANVGRIGRVNLPSKTITEFSLPSSSEQPLTIAPGPDKNLWFTDSNGIVGKITTSGVVTEYHPSFATAAGYITAGPDGNMWFAASYDNGQTSIGYIGRISTADGSNKGFEIPNQGRGTSPGGIAAGPDGNIWFTSSGGVGIPVYEIGKVTTTGVFTEYPISTTAEAIAPLTNNALAFTALNAVGFITTGGQITYHYIARPTGTRQCYSLTKGLDGNIWMTGSETVHYQSRWEVLVYLRQLMTVTPSPLVFNNVGQTLSLTVGEKLYKGSWTATTSNANVVKVAPGSNGYTFQATSTGSGSATVSIADSEHNVYVDQVTVP